MELQLPSTYEVLQTFRLLDKFLSIATQNYMHTTLTQSITSIETKQQTITICDPVCEKGSYRNKWTNLQGDTKFTCKVMGRQVHAIEKAIRSFSQTGSHFIQK